jgi:hypothetical protein
VIYVWGGGWQQRYDPETQILDQGNNFIGPNPLWKSVYEENKSNFLEIYPIWKREYENGDSKFNDFGLDCSGFAGWVVYNVMETQGGQKGYTCSAMDMARNFSERGWGELIPYQSVKDIYKPGDILSGNKSVKEPQRHVLICVGQCKDGSFLGIHSSPIAPHVFGSGRPGELKNDTKSQAYLLASNYMKNHHKDLYDLEHKRKNDKYTPFYRDWDIIEKYDVMRWHITENSVLKDPDGLRSMSAKKILKLILQPISENRSHEAEEILELMPQPIDSRSP